MQPRVLNGFTRKRGLTTKKEPFEWRFVYCTPELPGGKERAGKWRAEATTLEVETCVYPSLVIPPISKMDLDTDWWGRPE